MTAPTGSFGERIQELIDEQRDGVDDPWAALSVALRSEVALRRKYHREGKPLRG